MADDLLVPAYGACSLADLLPAVATAIGVDGVLPETSLELPPAAAYVVLLVDGLGEQQLAAHRNQAAYLHSLLGRSLTAGVPSTTATSLTSLGTALPPGQHGVCGFVTRVPQTGALLNALWWDQPVDPEQWQPHPTAFERLARAGVATSVVSKGEFVGSGLTRCAQRGASYAAADDPAARLAGALEGSARRPSVTYVYDGDLDWHGHRAGVDSSRWRGQLRDIDEDVQELRDALPEDVRLVVTGDHGMVDTTPATSLDLDSPELLQAGLRDGVTQLGGEARFRQVWCRAGAAYDVAATWSALLGDRATVLTRDEAVARGWFGPVAESVAPRLGEVVAAAHGTWALFSSADYPYETRLVGLHGSLTPAETEVPLLVC